MAEEPRWHTQEISEGVLLIQGTLATIGSISRTGLDGWRVVFGGHLLQAEFTSYACCLAYIQGIENVLRGLRGVEAFEKLVTL